MKRSRHVTLVLLGTTALAGCQDDRTAPPPPVPRPLTESLALPAPPRRCDRPEDFPLPECHDPQASPAASGGSTGGHARSASRGWLHWFVFGNRASYGPATPAAHASASAGAAVRAATPAGPRVFGGFGASGRAAASSGGGE